MWRATTKQKTMNKAIKYITAIALLTHLTAQSQVQLHSASINVKGDVTIFEDVTGTGSITIADNQFTADNIVCPIKMIHRTSNQIRYTQPKVCKTYSYNYFNIIGQHLGKGVYKNNRVQAFERKYLHSYIIVVFDNKDIRTRNSTVNLKSYRKLLIVE